MKVEEVRLADEDRRLLEDTRRLLQQNAALTRGLLAVNPRPEPPGDWGRSSSPAEPMRSRGVQAVAAPAVQGGAAALGPVVATPIAVLRPRRGVGGAEPRLDWPPEARIRKLYDAHAGNVAAVAREMGFAYQAVYWKLRGLGLHRSRRRLT